MTDDLDKMREMLAVSAPPAPNAEHRRRAISASMSAFDTASEQTELHLQGSADQIRHRDRQSSPMALLRRWMMNITQALPQTKTIMLGSASMAVLAMAVIATQDIRTAPIPEAGETFAPSEPLSPAPAPSELSAGNDAFQSQQGAGQQSAGLSDDASQAQRPALGRSQDTDAEFAPAPGIKREPAAQSAEIGSDLSLQQSEPTATRKARPTSRARAELRAPADAAQAQLPIAADRIVGETDSRPTATRPDAGRDNFERIEPNPQKITAETPVSTFSIDVDTASYSFMRSSLMNGVLPPKDAVRIEELINYFPYSYPAPDSRDTPFQTDVRVMPTPWNDGTQLMRIGIKGYELSTAEKPRSNLVFLLDTSGSMNNPNKLPLLINSFRMMIDNLDPDDTVSIVVYAGSAGTVLEPTPVADKAKILASLDRLRAGGSTAGGEGIRQAYRLAEANFDEDGINRVILATDGDFNVGITDQDDLKSFIERKRESGVFLSVLGFGRGNYNDALMQTLAQSGNGQAAYIDTLSEARKVLVDEASSSLFPIAKDVKIQVEFNPASIAEYRLIGYETRLLAREDFNNDAIDAGEIGSGHTVTALYEITPVGSDAQLADPLRYGANDAANEAADESTPSDEYAFIKIRYKHPDSDRSRLIERPVGASDQADLSDGTDADARFSAAVAAFGQLLRGGRYTRDYGYADVIELANSAKGEDPFGYRAGFVDLVRLAQSAAALEPQRR